MATVRPVESDAALFAMLAQTSLVAPRPIFVSLQVFLARFEPGAAG
jgi:tRNA (cmo5U34)-methyltransferase